ncbi:MAG: methyltransferase domain-containing protein [Planctomycetes bacterium]|nr:methyltransferase domain-containing protein [Planctomycetota bacterium]
MSDDGTGGYPWPAGERLTRDLAAIVSCAGLTVCDLGCGRGALGCAALASGARRVAFADVNPDALATAEAIVADRGWSARASFHRHRWDEPIPLAPYDLILGGDILYRPDFFSELMSTIAASLAADGRCLLSDPRKRLDPELAGLASAHGLALRTKRRSDHTIAWLTVDSGHRLND